MSRIDKSFDSMTLHNGQVMILFTKPSALQPAMNSNTCTSARTARSSLLGVCHTSTKNFFYQRRYEVDNTGIIEQNIESVSLKGARGFLDIPLAFKNVVNGWYTPLCSLPCLPMACMHVIRISRTMPISELV